MQKILDENLKPIGCVASGTYSPLNKMPIGSAYISDSNVIPSSLKNFYIDIRGNFEKAEVVSPPFHKMKK
ncbi:MAG: glycine cleavage T C-terminal barrel domain-containing protein, partial [bacterium]